MSCACKCGGEVFEGSWYAHPLMRNALIAGGLTSVAFISTHFIKEMPSFFEIPFYIAAILIGGYHWTREGIEELIKEREIGIEILMLAATIGSAVLGMWDEAAFLVFLYGAAEGLEEYTYAKTRASIRKLLELAPKEARVLRNGEEVTIEAKELKLDDIFIVKPGESLPTDGVIMKGSSSINEAAVTGESIPVEKETGMKVFAATMNQAGVLEVKVTATFENNTLSKIVHLVEEAQEQKGKTQLFIEEFGKRYSPAVLLCSLILLAIPFIFHQSFSWWAIRAVVLLVAAAPCALIMSTPVAIAAGIGRAGKSGVLIKGGMHLENLGKVKAIAFDKTGTLTKGKPVVTEIVPVNEPERNVLELAYSVERFSEHPLAQAIVEKAIESKIRYLEANDFSALVGAGAKARVRDQIVYAAKAEFFKELGHDISGIADIQRLRNQGNTLILVGTEKKIAGLIAIRDEVRPEALKAIHRLKEMGIKIAMLTGDNAATAKAIADHLNIDEVKADLKPEDKIKAIEELKKEHGEVAMVGDGINDAPALAKATVGIAMGAAGTDAAIEAADIALMADDLEKVVFALELGRKARKVSRQNIVFSLALLAVLVPSALAGFMTVAIAVIVHESSELLAVANGLRLTRD
ncbi:MAG: heavy metal translocating P-type ATPase [Candidatus Omnitrophota bacterium]